MKIYEDQGSILGQTQRSGHKKGTGSSEFQKVMDQTSFQIEQKGESLVQRPLGVLPEAVQILSGPEKVGGAGNRFDQGSLVDALGETLDLVEFYAGRLGDTSLPAEDMDPLVTHLEERLTSLKDLESAQGMPEKLRPVISDLMVTLGTEIAKYRRGDYN